MKIKKILSGLLASLLSLTCMAPVLATKAIPGAKIQPVSGKKNLCWASCAAVICGYLSGKNVSPKEMVMEFFPKYYHEDKNATLEMIIDFVVKYADNYYFENDDYDLSIYTNIIDGIITEFCVPRYKLREKNFNTTLRQFFMSAFNNTLTKPVPLVATMYTSRKKICDIHGKLIRCDLKYYSKDEIQRNYPGTDVHFVVINGYNPQTDTITLLDGNVRESEFDIPLVIVERSIETILAPDCLI